MSGDEGGGEEGRWADLESLCIEPLMKRNRRGVHLLEAYLGAVDLTLQATCGE
jgi:hypothetical protein